ncbi:APC family permease [Solirubrobacter soli]|uniref:APC family permease n=1 Tax=Solirubrobacter soli TaxID=363832 RepID=UPI0004211919|nr:APC family permease [Solirubrobacter soli]
MENAPLKRNAIGYASSVVIGVASTAPGYSLAAVLGLIVAVAGVGVHAPGVLIVSFVPMLLVALGYKYLNKADPDAGTTFAWATRAFGPRTGWLGGWAIIVADLIVMANLAQIAGLYSFLLLGVKAPSTLAVTAVGVVWIAIMTAVCVIGVEVNARTQRWLLAAEIVTLAAFAVVALVRVGLGDGAATPSASWFNPFAVGSVGALTSGLLVAIFIYWGWDSLVCVNEETEDCETVPGKAAVMSVLILVGIYVIVATAAIAFGGVDRLAGDSSGDVLGLLAGDVFGSAALGKVMIVAVLTSAAASTQTTILPTSRTALSMARAKAAPAALAAVHPRYLTPHVATWIMGGLSIAWYVGLTVVSTNILFDSIAALGLMIAFYYGLTGFACAWYYRRALTHSLSGLLLAGVAPFVGGAILAFVFIRSCFDLGRADAGSTTYFGIGSPLVIGVGFLLLGVVLMFIWRLAGHREFFARKPSAAAPDALGSARDHHAVGAREDLPAVV